MIVGNGLLAKTFSPYANSIEIIIFASGVSNSNSTIPDKYKKEIKKEVVLKKHTIVGAGSIILPGVVLEEGTSVGAMSLLRKPTQAWSVYVGNPAKRLMSRKKDMLELEKEYLEEKEKTK